MHEEMDQNTSPDQLLDAVVVGGGQAGLAIAWHLKRQGLRFVVLEAGSELGHSWRDRWDSLKLFTPAQYDGLPGMPFSGSGRHLPDQGPGGRLPPDLCDRLRSPGSAQRPGDQPYPNRLRVPGPYRRRDLARTTGHCGHRALPGALCSASRPQGLDPSVTQVHSASYRNPEALPGGPVLVVGGGNSGFQIAEELAA